MKVIVTQKHIDQGRRHNPCRCPVALALDDLLVPPGGPTRYVYVGDESGWVGPDADHAYRFRLPNAAQAFIRNFDETGPKAVSPCEFNIEIPESCNLRVRNVV